MGPSLLHMVMAVARPLSSVPCAQSPVPNPLSQPPAPCPLSGGGGLTNVQGLINQGGLMNQGEANTGWGRPDEYEGIDSLATGQNRLS